MCVLCSDLVMKQHWTDISLKTTYSSQVMVGDKVQREYRRNRLHKVKILNYVLSFYGMSIRDWNGAKFVLSDSKGNSSIVQDLGEVWSEVEKWLGKPLDPLNQSLLQRLKEKAH